jgi:hypothetical protein
MSSVVYRRPPQSSVSAAASQQSSVWSEIPKIAVELDRDMIRPHILRSRYAEAPG